MFATHAEIQRAFIGALEKLGKLALANSDNIAEAKLILVTVAKMPGVELVGPLSSLESEVSTKPAWAPVSLLVSGLLDFLDLERVPVKHPTGSARKAE